MKNCWLKIIGYFSLKPKNYINKYRGWNIIQIILEISKANETDGMSFHLAFTFVRAMKECLLIGIFRETYKLLSFPWLYMRLRAFFSKSTQTFLRNTQKPGGPYIVPCVNVLQTMRFAYVCVNTHSRSKDLALFSLLPSRIPTYNVQSILIHMQSLLFRN